MWKMILVATMCVGCVAGGERAAVQEVTGVTVTVRDAGQLAVSWTADPLASRYLVYQSVGGALPALVATVFDSGGGAPSTSWIATNLTGGVEYCFAIRSGFADGGVGAPGGSGCATAGGGETPVSVRTIPIAVNGPRAGAGPGFQGDALYVSGPVQSAVFQIAGIPVGSMITAARVRVRDSADGPTRLSVQLMPSIDGSQRAPIATSITSAGTGAAQTLPLSGIAAVVAPLTTYSLYVSNTTGVAQWSVVAIDVDYIPVL